jgi:hypothetical protein
VFFNGDSRAPQTKQKRPSIKQQQHSIKFQVYWINHAGNSSQMEIPSMKKKVLRVSGVILIGFVCGILGLVIGALIGGNFAEQFVFNGVRGYEATGQVGLIFGALAGLFAGWWFLIKK